MGGYSFVSSGSGDLCRDGQGGCGLLQARTVGFLLDRIRYRDKDLGGGFLNEAETGHQEVGISLVERDVGLVMLGIT
jgi:hypothetical protein